jgi:hypothetical protein
MKLTFSQPRLELGEYVESMWVFESEFGLPSMDPVVATPLIRGSAESECATRYAPRGSLGKDQLSRCGHEGLLMAFCVIRYLLY